MRITIKSVLIGIAVSTISFPVVAAESDGISVSLGLKTWISTWATPDVTPGAVSLRSVNSGSETAVIPQLTGRYRNWFVSGSTLLSTRYQFSDSLSSFSATRNEWDVNAGYFLLPGLALSVGYKNVELDNRGVEFKVNGATLGLSGTAPISERVGLYGNLATGINQKIESSGTRLDNDYTLFEGGLSYSFSNVGFAKNLAITAGYRAQIIKVKPPTPVAGELKEDTHGLTLGLVASF